MTQSLKIQWPDHYQPDHCPVHVRNELDMATAPACVWAWLTHPTLWPAWYVNASNVQMLESGGPDLQQGTRFRWKTFGVTITSTVLEYIPGKRIAWNAKGLGVDAYHAWLLQPSALGCWVLTEETQHGWLARLGNLFLPKRMHKYHQIWLEGLARKAGEGLPPVS